MAATNQESKPRYERLHFVLGQGDRAEAGIVKDALQARGIGRTVECEGRVDRLFDILDGEIVDLVVYDVDLLNEGFADVMQRVRRKARGRNPFVAIIAAVNDAGTATQRILAPAGVDDIMVRPITGQRLFESIGRLMQRRKPFMVTHDYVGPLRRLPSNGEPPAGTLMRVPNTLRSRAIEGIEEEDLEKIVESASASLRDRHVVACGTEVATLGQHLVDAAAVTHKTPERADEERKILDRLERAAEELRDRCRGSEYERICDLARMVLVLTERLRRGIQREAAIDVRLIGKLAEAIRRAVTSERDSVAVMRDIANTIADYTGDN